MMNAFALKSFPLPLFQGVTPKPEKKQYSEAGVINPAHSLSFKQLQDEIRRTKHGELVRVTNCTDETSMEAFFNKHDFVLVDVGRKRHDGLTSSMTFTKLPLTKEQAEELGYPSPFISVEV